MRQTGNGSSAARSLTDAVSSPSSAAVAAATALAGVRGSVPAKSVPLAAAAAADAVVLARCWDTTSVSSRASMTRPCIRAASSSRSCSAVSGSLCAPARASSAMGPACPCMLGVPKCEAKADGLPSLSAVPASESPAASAAWSTPMPYAAPPATPRAVEAALLEALPWPPGYTRRPAGDEPGKAELSPGPPAPSRGAPIFPPSADASGVGAASLARSSRSIPAAAAAGPAPSAPDPLEPAAAAGPEPMRINSPPDPPPPLTSEPDAAAAAAADAAKPAANPLL